MRYPSLAAVWFPLALIATICLSPSVATHRTAPDVPSNRDQIASSDHSLLFERSNLPPDIMEEVPKQFLASDRRFTGSSSESSAPTTLNTQLLRRRLPGNDYNIEGFDMMSAEAGFALGLSFFIILLLLLCCCCCGRRGGGGGSSCLWDLVAIVCLWEMCCDNDGVSDGFLRF